MRRIAPALGGAALALLAGVLVVATGLVGGRGGHGAAPVAAPAPPAADGSAPAASELPALPASLRGTEVDGGLVVDARGRFTPTPDAIALFDYFLSATGEEPLATIRARIVAEIRRRLAPAAARDAEALLDQYLAYRDAARELFESGAGELPLARRIQRIRELRRGIFGAEVARVLFGEEEARWFVEVERRRVASDPDLTPEERTDRLAALDEELPADVRETRRATLAALRLRRDEARLREQGAGPAEIQALREERFGPEAAARLAALDAQRAAWAARLARYREARDELLAEEAEAPAPERAARLEALRAEHFQGPELLRVRALDRAERGSQPAEDAQPGE